MDSLACLDVFDQLTDAVVAFSDDGEIVYANESARLLHGGTDLVGRGMGEFTTETARAGSAARFEALRRDGHVSGEHEILSADGRVTRLPFRAAARLPDVHLTVFETRRFRRPGGRDDLFRAVFDTAPDPIVLIDDERRYLQGNRAARGFLGVSREELLRRRIDDFTPPDAGAELDRIWAMLLARGALEGVFPLLLPNGLQRKVVFRARANVIPGHHAATFRAASAEQRATGRSVEGRAPGPALTPRERQVLTLLARGLTAGAMAEDMVLSAETVRTHARNALRKLGAHSRPHAVALAIARREIDP